MIVHACTNYLPDDQLSPSHMEEMVIVSNVRKNLVSMVNASRNYEKTMSSFVKFLLAKND